MNRRRFTFINALPYVIFTLTIAIVIFVGYTMFEDYKKSMNPDDQTSEGISMILGTTSGNVYVGDERIEVSILGQNYGALTCTSTDEKVASCGINGTTLIVKPGTESGKAVIVVKEASGNNTVAYEIEVEDKNSTDKDDDKDTKPNTGSTTGNTGSTTTSSLSLSYSYGTIYVGNTATLYIKGNNYGELSCSSSNTTVATCSISGTKLLISPKTTGSATITVKGTSGKSATYKATVAKKSTSTNTSTGNNNFYLSETKGVTSIGGSALVTTVKGSNFGTVSCATSNRSIALCGVNGNEIKITPQTKSGTVSLTVTESKNNKTATYTVTVLPKGVTEVPTLTLSSTSGTTKGTVLPATVGGTNYGRLTCSSSSNAIATCIVKDNVLSITPKKDGEATITVKEATAGITVTYKVTVSYEYECLEGTLTKDVTYGTICITPGYETEEASCSKYGTPTIYDDIDSVDDASYETEDEKMECKLNPNPFNIYDKYTCVLTIKQCLEYDYVTAYTCPKGWSTYSGSNSTLKCYKSASVRN